MEEVVKYMTENIYHLPFKSTDIVAELGGGQNSKFHPNIDIRKMDGVDIVANFNKKLPIPDNSYNGIFSNYNLEHISWRRIRPFLREIFRILKPNGTVVFITANLLEQTKAIANANQLDDSLVCMIFGGQKFGQGTGEEELEEDWDANSHHSGFSPEFITKILTEIGYNKIKIIPVPTFVNAFTDMIVEASKPMTQITDAEFKEFKDVTNSAIKLNIGSFTVMHKNDWINLDILDLNQYANQNNFIFRQADCSNNIPYQDNNVDLITVSHFIEHLDKYQGKQFLREVLRVLKPGGLIRLTIPDANIICQDYLSGNISRHASHNEGVKNSENDTESLFHLLIAGHKTIYDFNSLSKLLKDTGFVDIEKMEYQKSKSKIIEKENIDMYPELSTHIEARKPEKEQREQMFTCNGVPIQSYGTGPTITYGLDNKNLTTNVLSIKDKLRIAIISTPFFSVPPTNYGGLEQVLWDLAMGLDKLGHTVTIFGPKGSKATPNGKLFEMCESNNTVNVNWYDLEKQNYEIYKNIIDPKIYDIVHDSTWFGFPYLLKQQNLSLRILHQHHGGYSWPSIPPFGKPNLVSISMYMKQYTEQYFRQLGYDVKSEYIYNPIDIDKYPFQATKTEHLLFVGRLSTFKQPHIAVEVAKKSNHKLDIIGGTFVDSDQYVMQLTKMVENDPDVTLYKDVSNESKIEKMQNAKALLFPSKMNEPFGLVALETMSCGTPVIALNDGAISEVVIHGKTGFICNNIQEMIDSISKIHTIKSEDCRLRAEQFSRENIAKEYEKLYYRMMKGENW